MAEPTGGRALLIVDDEAIIRRSLAEFLRQSGYAQVEEAGSGPEAIARLREQSFFLMITDISMPGMTGIELLAHVRQHHADTDVAVITGHQETDYAIEALKNGAFDYFRKPFRYEEVINTVRRVEEKQYLQRRSLELELVKARRQAEEQHLKELLLTLAKVIDMKSPYTREHSERCSRISALIAQRLDLSRDEVERVALGARLHDIGKIATPDAILNKAGRLDRDEYARIQEHPSRGAELIQNVSCLTAVVPMVRWHHENLDGSGYPDGLRGQEIPIEARIVRIADYWDAITSYRSYRSPMSTERAVRTLEAEVQGNRLDGEIVKVLFDCVRSGQLQRIQSESVNRVGQRLRALGHIA